MEKEIFKFNESFLKEDFVRENKLIEKIDKAFRYLEGKLPINEYTENVFDNLKIREEKNYDYFIIKDGDVTLLIRQYSTHFTFYCYFRSEEYMGLRDKISIFTLLDDFEHIGDELHDKYVNDNFLTLKSVLPKIIENVRSGRVHGMWNNYSFERPKFTEVKIVTVGETTTSLDLLLFACEEIFRVYQFIFAENEMYEKVKTLKVGDKFGTVSEIVEVRTELKDDYYHNIGLSTKRIDDWGKQHEKKSDWHDVYSLTSYYYDEMFPDIKLEQNCIKFYQDKWREVYQPFTKMYFNDEMDYMNCFLEELWNIHQSCLLPPIECEESQFRGFISKNCGRNIKYYYDKLIEERK